MSMTIIAFVNKANIPNRAELEVEIEKLGYDFNFLDEFNKIDEFEGACKLNGIETFFEVHAEEKGSILEEFPSLDENLDDYDYGISFIWGSDFVAGACIGIVSLALMDICNSKVLYVDDEIWYTREMFIQEVPIFLEEHQKESKTKINNDFSPKKTKNKNGQFKSWLLWGLVIISVILLKRGIISWPIPAVILVLVVANSIIEERKKRQR